MKLTQEQLVVVLACMESVLEGVSDCDDSFEAIYGTDVSVKEVKDVYEKLSKELEV